MVRRQAGSSSTNEIVLAPPNYASVLVEDRSLNRRGDVALRNQRYEKDLDVPGTGIQILVRRFIEEYLLVDRIPHLLVELFYGSRVENVVEAQLDLGLVG